MKILWNKSRKDTIFAISVPLGPSISKTINKSVQKCNVAS